MLKICFGTIGIVTWKQKLLKMVSNIRDDDDAVSRPSPKASYQQLSTASIATDPLFPNVDSVWDSENRSSRSFDRGEISFASPKPSPAKSFKVVGSPAISKLSLNGGNVPMPRRGCTAIHSKLSDAETEVHSVQVNSSMPGGSGSKHTPTLKSNSAKDLTYDFVLLHSPHISMERNSKRLSSSSIHGGSGTHNEDSK